MKLKQIQLIIAAFVFSVATGVGFVALGPTTDVANAYKCVGTPDDYYFEAPGSFGENKAKLPAGSTAKSTNFHWDESLARCTVTVINLDDKYKSQNADGSAQTCKGASDQQVKVNGVWYCAKPATYPTNDKPVNDDGSPLDLSKVRCNGEQDNYDEESFSCKESGSCNYNPLDNCEYHKVELDPDPTTDCIGGGGIYNKNNQPTCKFTEDSCKAKGLKMKADASACEDQNDCDKKFGVNNTKSDEYKACTDAMNDPNKNCAIYGNDAQKKACETGKAGAQEAYDHCGEAETVLIKCETNAEGTTAIQSVLKIAINVLSVIIGIAAVGGLAWASILYAKAQDNEGNTKDAKELIRNIVIGLLLYGFMVAIINWLVPGGVIG